MCLLAWSVNTQASETEHLWAPVADSVYLQEVGMKVPTETPVTALGLHKGVPYAVVDGKSETPPAVSSDYFR